MSENPIKKKLSSLYGKIGEPTRCLGFDKDRPEDEPTEEELKEFEKWCDNIKYDDTDSVYDVNNLFPYIE